MDLKDKNSEEFKELKKYVFEGKYTEIDNWFKKNKISLKDEKNLVMRMVNEYYFFSFQTSSTDIKFLSQETLNRELAVLKNFSCENQLKLLGPTLIEEFNFEHFKLIASKPENIKILKNSNTTVWALTDLLNKEKFEDIDKIQEMLKYNILEQKSSGVVTHYGDKNSRGVRNIFIEENFFTPKCNIIFMPSKAKEEYLKSKGIELPTSAEAINLKLLIKKSMDNSTHWRHQDIEEVERILNNYIIKSSYDELSNDLESNNTKTKKSKI